MRSLGKSTAPRQLFLLFLAIAAGIKLWGCGDDQGYFFTEGGAQREAGKIFFSSSVSSYLRAQFRQQGIIWLALSEVSRVHFAEFCVILMQQLHAAMCSACRLPKETHFHGFIEKLFVVLA
jgi:hypothetical protein